MPDRLPPAEALGRGSGPPIPDHPGGEDAVEQRLDQGGSKKPLAPVAPEADPQRLFERLPQDVEAGGGFAGGLQPREAVAGVGGEQVRQILRIADRRPVGERPLQVFDEAGAEPAGKGLRSLQAAVERLLVRREREGLQAGLAVAAAPLRQSELPQIRSQHEPVARPVAGHLLGSLEGRKVVSRRLHFDDAPLRLLARPRAASSHLAGGEESEVGPPGVGVGELGDADDPWFQRSAHRIQQVGEGAVGRKLRGPGARGANPPQAFEPVRRCRGEPASRPLHLPEGRFAAGDPANAPGPEPICPESGLAGADAGGFAENRPVPQTHGREPRGTVSRAAGRRQ